MKWLKLTVLVFLLGAIQCHPMSSDELEDFQHFLKRTSQLDQTIRKGVDPDDDEDEDQAVSDHAWEESGKFEGDLILNDRQRRVIVQDVAEGLSRNGLKDSTKRWPNNEVIYYIQKDHFSGAQVEAIQNGINDLAQASCVKFRPYQKGDRDAVVIQGSRRGCFSQVGYQSGYQVLNLSGRHPVGRGCFRHGTVVHELLHTLGFYHMQSSPDRDDYIDVIWENIRKPARHNFRKYNAFSVSDFGVGYDYDSVLHYSRRAFSTNGQDTLVPKKGGAEIGQRVGLSDKDTQKLNKMYCDADSDNNSDDDDTTDDTTSKPVKKKKPKNKPFEGHGIGYHQGKTVVIKLLPAPETYKLPDVPSFHVFDYFSKAPQALSSTSEIEGFRTGKEMIYPYHLPTTVNTEEYSKPQLVTVNTEGEDWTNDEKISSIKSISSEGMRQPQQGIENITSEHWHNNEKSKYESSSTNGRNKTPSLPTLKDNITNTAKEFSPDGKKTEIASENMDVDLSDAFDSLAKIIKSHVYPSHTPNLNIFKAHKAHLEASNPDKSKVDEALLDHNEKVKSGMEMITEKYGRSSMVASNADYNKENKNIEKTHSDGDEDSHSPRIHSYENYPYKTYSFSVNGPYKENDYVAPEYATVDDEVNDNYRDLDYYKEDNKSKKGPKRLPDDLRYKWYGEDTYYHKPSYGPALANLRSTVQTPYALKIIPYHSKYDIDEAYSSSSDKHEIHSLFGYPDSPDHTWLEVD